MLGIGAYIQDMSGWLAGQLSISESLAFLVTAFITVLIASSLSVGVVALVWKYRKLILRNRDLEISKFVLPILPNVKWLNALRLPTPTIKFNLSGWRGIAVSIGMVAVGFGLALTFVIAGTDDTKYWPEVGASYKLGTMYGEVGEPLEPDIVPTEPSQTLQINLVDGVRLSELSLTGLQIGRTNLTTPCFNIERKTSNTSGFLYVDQFDINNVSAPSLHWADTNVNVLTLNDTVRVDGHTNEVSLSAAQSEIVIESDRNSGQFSSTNSVVDRIIIELEGSATIGTLPVENVHCSISAVTALTAGAFDFQDMKVGHITMSNARFGDGDGIDAADAVWASSILAKSHTSNVVDTPIDVR